MALGAAVILGVGLLDDARELSAPAKVAGQVLAAMMLVILGATMFWLKIPLAGTVVLSSDLTPLITALWVIGITNAINLIDGLDGLAAGIVAIASGALAVYGLRLVELGALQASNLGPLIAVITCGVCLGFLPHNFNPARVFMGDAGALFLGLLMAAATMEIGGRTEGVSGQTYFFYAPCSSRCSSSAYRSPTWLSRTSGGWPRAPPSTPRTTTMSTIGSYGSATDRARTVVILWTWTAALSGFVLVPVVRAGVERHHPLRRPRPRPACCTPCSIRASGLNGASCAGRRRAPGLKLKRPRPRRTCRLAWVWEPLREQAPKRDPAGPGQRDHREQRDLPRRDARTGPRGRLLQRGHGDTVVRTGRRGGTGRRSRGWRRDGASRSSSAASQLRLKRRCRTARGRCARPGPAPRAIVHGRPASSARRRPVDAARP